MARTERAGSISAAAWDGSGSERPVVAAFRYYERLARVGLYVEEHLTDPIRLADVARVAGMERTSFSAFFRAKTGVCFRDWLARERVCRAAQLLQRRNLSIRRAALEAGFSSVRSCERAFTKVARRPPRSFKKAVRPA